jgi:hypothetical protein
MWWGDDHKAKSSEACLYRSSPQSGDLVNTVLETRSSLDFINSQLAVPLSEQVKYLVANSGLALDPIPAVAQARF